jgi:hypothetical protein
MKATTTKKREKNEKENRKEREAVNIFTYRPSLQAATFDSAQAEPDAVDS